jgi:hypothetical protein
MTQAQISIPYLISLLQSAQQNVTSQTTQLQQTPTQQSTPQQSFTPQQASQKRRGGYRRKEFNQKQNNKQGIWRCWYGVSNSKETFHVWKIHSVSNVAFFDNLESSFKNLFRNY